MIKLKKLDEPTILARNKENWTRKYVEAIKRGDEVPGSIKYKYRHPEIKDQIKKETSGHFYNSSEPLINPYKEYPEVFIHAVGFWIFHKPGKRRGELTIKKLQLNRKELLERRKEKQGCALKSIDAMWVKLPL